MIDIWALFLYFSCVSKLFCMCFSAFVSICLRSTDNGTLSSSWNTLNIAHAQNNLKRKIDLTTTKEKLKVKNKGCFQALFYFICPVFFFFQERHLQKWDLCISVRFIFFFYYLWHVPAGMSRIITCKSTKCGDKHLNQTHCLKLFTWSSLKSTRLLFHIVSN